MPLRQAPIIPSRQGRRLVEEARPMMRFGLARERAFEKGNAEAEESRARVESRVRMRPPPRQPAMPPPVGTIRVYLIRHSHTLSQTLPLTFSLRDDSRNEDEDDSEEGKRLEERKHLKSCPYSSTQSMERRLA
jgi:hypothetical protein